MSSFIDGDTDWFSKGHSSRESHLTHQNATQVLCPLRPCLFCHKDLVSPLKGI